MFYVNDTHCTGCGTCVDVCPARAIRLVNEIACIDQDRCTECEACVGACPNGAILMVTEPVEEKAALISAQPASQAILAERQLVSVPLRTKFLPVAGVALSFLGRQIAPRLASRIPVGGVVLSFLGRQIAPHLASYIMDALDQRLSGQAGTARSSDMMGTRSQRRGSHRFRQRRRGR